MFSLINRFGAANPQFLRECRGRLKPRSVMAAVGLSLLFQLLLLLSASNPDYIDQRIDFTQIVETLSWVMPYALFSLGGYYIVDDLTQEARTGTLNFIRLSPRPAREILLGKLLGVPALPMLLVLSAVPLHAFSALVTGLSPLLLLSYYFVVGCGTVTVFILALFVGLSSGTSKLTQQRAVSAIAFAGIALFALAPMFMLWNTLLTWQTLPTGSDLFRFGEDSLEWLYLDIARNPLFSHLFVLVNLACVSAIAWQIAVRNFRVPNATLLSKKLSYIGVAYANFVGWGFALSSELEPYDQLTLASALYFLNAALFLALMFALAPSRQVLLDWVRYRKVGQPGADTKIKTTGLTHSIDTSDWVWSDASPSMGAIAINFVIAAALIVPSLYWFSAQSANSDYVYQDVISPGAIVFATVSIFVSALTYATLVQLIFSRRLRAPLVWAAGCVAVLAIVPPLMLIFLELSPDNGPLGVLWTFLGFPLLGYARTQVPLLSGVGFVGQLCFLGFMLTRLMESLKSLAAPRDARDVSVK